MVTSAVGTKIDGLCFERDSRPTRLPGEETEGHPTSRRRICVCVSRDCAPRALHSAAAELLFVAWCGDSHFVFCSRPANRSGVVLSA